jgi:hypothetical protein
VLNAYIKIFNIYEVKTAVEEWQDSLEKLQVIRPELATSLNCEPAEIPETISGLDGVLQDLERLPKLKGDELLDCLPSLQGAVLDEANDYLQLFEDIQAHYMNLVDSVGPEVLEDLSSVDRFLSAREQLRQLVEGSAEIGMLSRTIQRLTRLQEQFSEIQDPISEVQATIEGEAGKYLNITESGLLEFKIFIKTVAALQPEYWRLRDDRFDNDELDQVLPQVRRELEALHTLRMELEGVYNLAALPDKLVLEKLKATIDAGGIFRWFQSSWRAARKDLLSHAASARVKFNAMVPFLEKAAAFAGSRQQFEKNPTYRELLGEHAKGLETPLPSLEALREWYRQVRNIYGVGFGPKVALGNAILDLPTGIARAIRSLAERGVDNQLDQILSELEMLKEIFLPVPDIQNGTALLAGGDGLITRLLNSLDEALRTCEPLISNATLSIAELSNRIEALDTLRKDVAKWVTADLDHKLFKGRLGLQIGLGINNTTALFKAQHTVNTGRTFLKISD